MSYYEVLKNRRLELHLSISEVASQMRLPIDGLMAVESHNLAFFDGDLNYCRALIQQYCIAIGVNWQALSYEVDHDLKTWFDLESTAYVSQSVPSSYPSRKYRLKKPESTKKVKRNSKLGGFSLKLSLSLFLITGLGVILLGNFLLQKAAEYNNEQAALEQQALLKEKEAETQALANQLKEQENKNAIRPQVTIEQGDHPNEFNLYNSYGEHVLLDVSFQLKEPGSVIISDGTQVLYESRGERKPATSLACLSEGQWQIIIDPCSKEDTITINGVNLPLDEVETLSEPITLHFVEPYSAPAEQAETDPYAVYDYGNELYYGDSSAWSDQAGEVSQYDEQMDWPAEAEGY